MAIVAAAGDRQVAPAFDFLATRGPGGLAGRRYRRERRQPGVQQWFLFSRHPPE
jgi:hypothetical protein